MSTPVVPWLSYSPLEPRFAGSNPAGFDGFFSKHKNPEYDFLRKGSKAVGPVLHIYGTKKEPQAEIRVSEQNLSDFSRSMSEATLMTYCKMLKSVVQPNNNSDIFNHYS